MKDNQRKGHEVAQPGRYPGFSEPGQSTSSEGGEYLNPRDVIGHLLMVWVIEYIEHAPTSKNPKGDAMVVDVVDLHPGQGKLYRIEWWRPGVLVGALKKVGVGNPEPILGVMRVKTMPKGDTFEIESHSQNPRAVALAHRWFDANPGFRPSVPQPREAPPERTSNAPAPATFNPNQKVAPQPDPWTQQQGWAQQAPQPAPLPAPASGGWIQGPVHTFDDPYHQPGFPDPYAGYAPSQQAPPQQAPPQPAPQGPPPGPGTWQNPGADPPPPDPAAVASILEQLRRQGQQAQGQHPQGPPSPQQQVMQAFGAVPMPPAAPAQPDEPPF